MNPILVNSRQANLDRFIEVMLTADKFGYKFYFAIKNKPELYHFFVNDLAGEVDLKFSEVTMDNPEVYNVADFIIEAGIGIFDHLVTKRLPESVEEIAKRIESYEKHENFNLSEASYQLLKNAFEKLELTDLDINNCILLGSVISAMDYDKEIKPHHVAEAIIYTAKAIRA